MLDKKNIKNNKYYLNKKLINVIYKNYQSAIYINDICIIEIIQKIKWILWKISNML